MLGDLRVQLQEVLRDQYTIERELSGGGMSRVFVATEASLARPVVVKVLPPELTGEISAERFRQEIQLAARLQHPHIVPVLSAGTGGAGAPEVGAEGLLYYTMPYIDGETLRSRLRREGELPVPSVVRIGREMASAMAYAHERGVVHRDLKPDNILLTRGHALVADFGVAKAVSAAARESAGPGLTARGVALGTPAYMAPEQGTADPAMDHRADIYSMGCVLYEMLSGAPPFSGRPSHSLIAAHASEPPELVSRRRPATPPLLVAIVMQMLEKRAADRPQSADEVLRALESLEFASPAALSGGYAVSTGATTGATAGEMTGATTGVTTGATTGLTTVEQGVGGRRRGAIVAAGAAVMLLAIVLVGLLLAGRRDGAGEPGDPRSVAVLPFRVAGADPSLAYLREGMLDLTYARLGDDGELRPVAPQTTMAAWRRLSIHDGEDPGADVTQRLARAVGAGRVLTGSVVGNAARMELSASLWLPPAARPSARASVAGPVDSLTHLIDQLLRQLLAQASGAQGVELGALTSTSLPALQQYLSAQAAYRHGRYEESVAAFERALQLDSGFAMAALGLYRAAGWVAVRGDQRERALDVGWRNRDRLSTRDRAILEAITGLRYPLPPPITDRFRLTQRALEHAPDHPELWYTLGDLYFHFGRRVGATEPEMTAEQYFRGAVERDSTFAGPLMHLVQLAALRRDTARADTYTTLLLKHNADGDAGEFTRWVRAHMRPDASEQRRARARFASMGTLPLAWIVIGAQQDGVGLEDADAAARELASRSVTPAERQRLLGILRDHQLNRGRPLEALRLGDEMLADGDADAERRRRVLDALVSDGDRSAAAAAAAALASPSGASGDTQRSALSRRENECTVALWRASNGDHTAASRAAASWAAARAANVVVEETTTLCSALIDLIVTRAAGGPGQAERLLRLERTLATTAPTIEGVTKMALLLLGRALSEAGEHDRAARALDRSLYFGPSAPEYWSSLLLERARAASRRGDPAASARAYDAYLALRDAPEPALAARVDSVRAARRLVSVPAQGR
jgi:eukaryotic-like serine/threonine-protein kinase